MIESIKFVISNRCSCTTASATGPRTNGDQNSSQGLGHVKGLIGIVLMLLSTLLLLSILLLLSTLLSFFIVIAIVIVIAMGLVTSKAWKDNLLGNAVIVQTSFFDIGIIVNVLVALHQRIFKVTELNFAGAWVDLVAEICTGSSTTAGVTPTPTSYNKDSNLKKLRTFS